MTRSIVSRVVRLALAAALGAGSVAALTSAPAVAQGAGRVTSYGKYCGPGVPAFTAEIGENDARIADLAGQWPPSDDLDALCYSHDYCFERLGMDNATCDDAIEATFQSFSATFQTSRPACSAQASNMAEAFRLKLWSQGDNAAASGGRLLRGINNIRNLGGNDARNAALRQGFAEVAARDCNIGATPSPRYAIDQFVAHVRSTGADFAICTPDDAAAGAC